MSQPIGRTKSIRVTIDRNAVKSGQGRIVSIWMNSNGATASNYCEIYDSLVAGSGTVIARVSSLNAATAGQFWLNFDTGLSFDVTGTVDLTVVYE